MINKNEIYEIEIETTCSDGNGIARINSMAVFVPEGVSGDILKVRIIKVNKSYAVAKIVEVIKPSDKRAQKVCKSFNKCGGCQMAHVSYEEQLRIKTKTVTDAIERIGRLSLENVDVRSCIGMENPVFYRNKMVFPVGYDKDGNLCGGFYAQKSHNVIKLSECGLGDPSCVDYLNAVLEYMKENNVKAYDEQKHKGTVRRVFLRYGKNTNECMLAVSVNADNLKNPDGLVKNILSVKSNLKVKSIILNINKGKNNLVLGDKNIVLFGAEKICDVLCGSKFEISANSFYQVNPVQTELLYNTAIDFCELCGTETVMDLYSGIGTISLSLAKRAGKVYGVEIVPSAVNDAKINAELNNIENAEFLLGSADECSEKLMKSGIKFDICVIDPPRKGSDEKTINIISKINPKKVIYISCNPATLARDLKLFNELGYKLKKVQPVDMFPHTEHVECCVLLCRND